MYIAERLAVELSLPVLMICRFEKGYRIQMTWQAVQIYYSKEYNTITVIPWQEQFEI